MNDKRLTNPGLSEKRQIDRIAYLDYLRVLATFAVMILHVSAENWNITNVDGYEWNVSNIYNSITRCCVPVFVMISGALFLKRNINIKKIYSKYVLRMVCSFLFWGGIYGLFTAKTFNELIKTTLRGVSHMWFIPMIIGLYMCIPLIQSIIQKEENMKYFMLLSFLFVFAFPQIVRMTNDFLSGPIQTGVSALDKNVNFMNLELVSGYTIYFILGYYLDSIDLTKKQRGITYLLGVIGFVSTIVLTAMISIKEQIPNSHYYDNTSLNVFLESIAVYVWFKYNVKRNGHFENIIMMFSKYSFGAYLIHMLIILQLDKLLGLNALTFNPALSIPIIGVIVFVISFGCSAVFNNLPILKKFIV